jgi:hypothetical protein
VPNDLATCWAWVGLRKRSFSSFVPVAAPMETELIAEREGTFDMSALMETIDPSSQCM